MLVTLDRVLDHVDGGCQEKKYKLEKFGGYPPQFFQELCSTNESCDMQ